jgi:iron complex outermembrane receptor protein
MRNFFGRPALPFGAFVLFFSICISGIAQRDTAQVREMAMADSTPVNLLDQVLIVVTRAHEYTPMSFTNVGAAQIAPLNNGQDLPYLLRFTPSMVVTSDAGNGVGYTGLWLRGSDPSRINVSINDIPLNDPESQLVFWVNTPDLGSSATSIQVQRGVGTSASSVGSFGGSVRIDTRNYSRMPFMTYSSNFGSFQTIRNTLAFGTGMIRDRFKLNVRLSQIASNGYLDRASTELYSAYAEGEYEALRSKWRLVVFSGREQTFQSWYGTPWEVLYGTQADRQAFIDRNGFDAEQSQNLLQSGRTYNYYQYPDQVDVYGQDHLQLHYGRGFRERLSLQASINYTHGQGYFEEQKKGESFERYGLRPITLSNDTIRNTDLVRRRWLRNHFVGGVFALTKRLPNMDLTWGGNVHQYLGEHFGELIWMQYAGATEKNHRYYEGRSDKRDASSYLRMNWKIGKKFDIYGDAQVRWVGYQTQGTDNDLSNYEVDQTFLFFNPKAGVHIQYNPRLRLYASAAIGNKEPNRNDFVDAIDIDKVQHESMIDYELGGAWKKGPWECGGNLYYMDYTNQLVLNGTLNDVGAPLRTNVAESYRAGMELTASYTKKWNENQQVNIAANATWSRNRIARFDNVVYDYGGEQTLTVVEQMKDVPISFSPDVISGVQVSYDRFTLYPHEYTMRSITEAESKVRTRAPFTVMLMWKLVGKQFMDNTGNDALALDAYQVLDARVSYEIVSKREGGTLECSLGVNNLLNTAYVSNGYTYSYIFGEKVTERFYYPQALRQFNLGLKFTI